MDPDATHDYVAKHLPEALRIVQTGGYATAHPELAPAEKALIYDYTGQGSTAINQVLHGSSGVLFDKAQMLVEALQKLPAYKGTVYSAAHLAPAELARLRATATTGNTLATAGTMRWPAFLSASRSRRVAGTHAGFPDALAPKNCLLLISSRTGRDIEQLSCYGPNGNDPLASEQEVLFLPNARFAIVGVDFTTPYPTIELVEI